MRQRRVMTVVAVLAAAQVGWVQSGSAPPGPKMSFEVVSVKPSAPVTPGTRGGGGRANIPLTPGDRYVPNDGYFSAPSQTVESLIAFVYSMENNAGNTEFKALPDWVKTKRWDIEARAAHPATKDQMRAMVLSLLQDRFKMTAHYDMRNMPVYAVTMIKPGHFGPQMREHVEDGFPCTNQPGASLLPMPPAAPAADAAPAPAGGAGRGAQRATPDGYPMTCGDDMGIPGAPPGRSRFGGRNVTMTNFMADFNGGLERIGIDRTGLTGRYDWWIEWVEAVETDGHATPNADPTGPSLWTAFKEQLGLEVKPVTAEVPFLVVDHIEEPTAD